MGTSIMTGLNRQITAVDHSRVTFTQSDTTSTVAAATRVVLVTTASSNKGTLTLPDAAEIPFGIITVNMVSDGGADLDVVGNGTTLVTMVGVDGNLVAMSDGRRYHALITAAGS